jgi:hypothetical protein
VRRISYGINSTHDIDHPCLAKVRKIIPRSKVISECRTAIQCGLSTFCSIVPDSCRPTDDIITEHKLSKKGVVMNYNNYEWKIVKRFGVALQGWPVGTIRNPASVNSRIELDRLHDALTNMTCKWTKLSEADLSALKANNKVRSERGEQIYKARKRKRLTKDDMVDSGDEGEGGADGAGEAGNNGTGQADNNGAGKADNNGAGGVGETGSNSLGHGAGSVDGTGGSGSMIAAASACNSGEGGGGAGNVDN